MQNVEIGVVLWWQGQYPITDLVTLKTTPMVPSKTVNAVQDGSLQDRDEANTVKLYCLETSWELRPRHCRPIETLKVSGNI